jgi:hypothetical protein
LYSRGGSGSNPCRDTDHSDLFIRNFPHSIREVAERLP